MTTELVPLTFNKIMQSRSYTVIILGSEKKQIAIYMEADAGKHIQAFLTNEESPRPYTHELLNGILRGFDIKILQVVIVDIEDTIYFARLFLEQTFGDLKQIIEIDVRPSDCIPLAIMNNVPLFCRKDILEKAIAVEE